MRITVFRERWRGAGLREWGIWCLLVQNWGRNRSSASGKTPEIPVSPIFLANTFRNQMKNKYRKTGRSSAIALKAHLDKQFNFSGYLPIGGVKYFKWWKCKADFFIPRGKVSAHLHRTSLYRFVSFYVVHACLALCLSAKRTRARRMRVCVYANIVWKCYCVRMATVSHR